MTKAVFRPFIMFWQEPILQVFGVYLAFLYGMIYRKQPSPYRSGYGSLTAVR